MLIIFSHSITQTSPQLEPLVFDAGKELQLRLTNFLNDKVFIEDDDGMNSRFPVAWSQNFASGRCDFNLVLIINIVILLNLIKHT